MIPYDYEMGLKLRVLKAICGSSDESAAELWREAMLVLSDGPRVNPLDREKSDDTEQTTDTH